MTYRQDGDTYFIRLERGERLRACLEQFVGATNISGAWLSGLGGASEVILGFYNLDTKKYQWKTFERLMEIASLTGNIAFDAASELLLHVHGTFAGDDYQALAGHVKDLVAGGTIELQVRPTKRRLQRVHDEAVGLSLLDLT